MAAFWETNRRECIELLNTEVFTANDTTMSAGTFDHCAFVHGHPVLGDGRIVVGQDAVRVN